MEAPYHVLLYYCFAPVDDPVALQRDQLALAVELDLRGRIIVSAEGLNGTVSGTPDACRLYRERVLADPRFATTDFKIDEAHEMAFNKIHVRIKREIVHAGWPHIRPWERTGQHLTPTEFLSLKDDPDVVLLDVRSKYEHELGHFKGAVRLDIDNLRELPDHLDELEPLKGKKVITYCTGGIKCEKASAYLIEQGFDNVYQLLGGIIRYGQETDGRDFDGRCYVFDNRLSVPINRANPTVVSRCHHCQAPTDKMINCANAACNDHLTLCPDCHQALEGACSEACRTHPAKRPYRPEGYYPKQTQGYVPGAGYGLLALDKSAFPREATLNVHAPASPMMPTQLDSDAGR